MVPTYWKECFVVLSIGVASINLGFIMTFPGVLNPVITSNLSDIHVTEEEASWITAAYGIIPPIGYLVFPGLMQTYGRRFIFRLINTLILSGTIVLATATGLPSLIIGRALQGCSFCLLYVNCVTIGEYCHPTRRGTGVLSKIICMYIGIISCLSLSLVLTWRQVAWISTIPTNLGIFSSFIWPDTPYWLVLKGRIDECKAAFKWLRGNSSYIEEAHELIKMQENNNVKKVPAFRRHMKALRSTEFSKQLGVMTLVLLMNQSAGTFYLFSYGVEIMQALTGNKLEAVYYSIGIAAVKFAGIIVCTAVERLLPRRRILLISGFISCASLGLMCILDYLNKIHVLHNTVLPACVLLFYCFTSSAGVIPLSIVLKSEIFSLRFKGTAITVSGIINSIFTFLVLKCTSNLLRTLDLYGTIGIYATICLSSVVALHYTLPETKDRHLQAIENDFKKEKGILNNKCEQKTETGEMLLN